MNIVLRPIALVVGLTALPLAIFAHFKLLEPAEWLKTNDLGDPQKPGPCGLPDTNGDNAKLLTNSSTKVTGGSKFHLKIQETVFHSGHYRVALAVNSRNDLPPDPVTAERWTEKGPYSTWAQIQSPPQIPVLADGLFPHYPKMGEPASKRVDPKAPMIWETVTSNSRISIARNAPCRWSNSWRTTHTTFPVGIRTITARLSRSPRIRQSRSTPDGRRVSSSRNRSFVMLAESPKTADSELHDSPVK